MEQCPVGRNIDFKPFFMADIEQFIDLGMKQRLAF